MWQPSDRPSVQIRTLRADDLPSAMRLSRQAGWNQCEADWRRLLDLAPEHCFAGTVDGEVIATSTLNSFGGAVGWIGMMLVDEDHRRRGFGTRIFERVLDAAVEEDLATVGLDATDAGRSVYADHGFVDVAPVERWSGRIDAPRGCDGRYVVTDDPPTSTVLEVDRRACDIDRSDLLCRFAAESRVATLLVSAVGTGEAVGYAVVRPGLERPQVGPVVASDVEAIAALLAAADDAADGSDVLLDVPGRHGVESMLERANLRRERRLTRMTYREPVRTLLGDDVVAAAGLELG